MNPIKEIFRIAGIAALLLIVGTRYAAGQLYTPDGEVEISTSGTNIGVGKASPDAKLHVFGDTPDLFLLELFDRSGVSENLLRIIGDTEVQNLDGSIHYQTLVNVDRTGRTRIGRFHPSEITNTRLTIKDDMRVQKGPSWMQFQLTTDNPTATQNSPTIVWKASGNNSFSIQNAETGRIAYRITPEGKTGFGTNSFDGDQILRVGGGSLHDRLWVQRPENWGQNDEYIQLKLEAGPEVKWESSTNDILRFHGNGNDVMLLSSEGKVGVGKDFVPAYFLGSNHSLYVKGSAVAEEIFVLLKDDWGDFVFEKDYNLMPLNELEDYLSEYKHLPDFPSAAEVKEEGLALGETERLLTIKVEELTLYLLQMNKEMEALREEITTLRGEK